MYKYFTKIQLLNADQPDYLRFHTELLKEAASRFKISSVLSNKLTPQAAAEYDVEGNVSITALGRLVSKIAARINKQYSFTIIRKKPGLEYV